jgi:hypothetical protein
MNGSDRLSEYLTKNADLAFFFDDRPIATTKLISNLSENSEESNHPRGLLVT